MQKPTRRFEGSTLGVGTRRAPMLAIAFACFVSPGTAQDETVTRERDLAARIDALVERTNRLESFRAVYVDDRENVYEFLFAAPSRARVLIEGHSNVFADGVMRPAGAPVIDVGLAMRDVGTRLASAAPTLVDQEDWATSSVCFQLGLEPPGSERRMTIGAGLKTGYLPILTWLDELDASSGSILEDEGVARWREENGDCLDLSLETGFITRIQIEAEEGTRTLTLRELETNAFVDPTVFEIDEADRSEAASRSMEPHVRSMVINLYLHGARLELFRRVFSGERLEETEADAFFLELSEIRLDSHQGLDAWVETVKARVDELRAQVDAQRSEGVDEARLSDAVRGGRSKLDDALARALEDLLGQFFAPQPEDGIERSIDEADRAAFARAFDARFGEPMREHFESAVAGLLSDH